jgi:hypothetical protein
MAETQQAIAASSPHESRISASDSYWMAEVSMVTLAQKFLNPLREFVAPQHGQVRLRRAVQRRWAHWFGTTCSFGEP